MRFAQNEPPPAAQNHDYGLQSVAPATKIATYLAKTSQKYCACHTKRLSTRYETCLNVTKCHACQAKRSNATCATSKSDPFCSTYHGHGHMGLARTVANGCERLRTVGQRRGNTPSTPRPHSETGNPCYAFGKKLPVDSPN